MNLLKKYLANKDIINKSSDKDVIEIPDNLCQKSYPYFIEKEEMSFEKLKTITNIEFKDLKNFKTKIPEVKQWLLQ